MKKTFFLIPFLVHCVSSEKKLSGDKADRPAEEIIHQARYLSQELADAGKENIEFLLEKLKTATDQYKLLRAHLLKLEDRVQNLVRRVRIQEEGTATMQGMGPIWCQRTRPLFLKRLIRRFPKRWKNPLPQTGLIREI